MYAAFLNVLMNSSMEKNQIVELPISENPDFETSHCSGLGELHPGKNVIKVQQYFEYLSPNPGTTGRTLCIAFISDGDTPIEIQENDGYVFYSEIAEPVGNGNGQARQYIYLPLIKYGKDGFNYGTKPDTAKFRFRQGETLCDVELIVVPTIGEEAYHAMINDLLSIHFQLVYRKNEKEKREYLSDCQRELEYLNSQVYALSKILKSLSREPMADIGKERARLPFRCVKHLDANVIMEHYVLQKPKVRTQIHKKNFNIYENQKIGTYICLLLKQLDILEKKIIRGDMEYQTEEKGRLLQNQQLKTQIQQMRARLNKFLKSDIFKGFKPAGKALYPLHTTNLFTNHRSYAKAFQLMRNYKKVGRLLEARAPYYSCAKSSEIYELWCFFKILELLMVEYDYHIVRVTEKNDKTKPYQFQAVNPSKRISDYIEQFFRGLEKPDSNAEAFYDFIVYLEQRDNPEHNIYLGYNCSLSAAQSKTVRPDILMIVDHKYIFTCDAKYKNYQESFMGMKEWYVDLFECAAYKYQYRMDERQMRFIHEKELLESDLHQVKKLEKRGCCILTPALTDSADVGFYIVSKIEEDYKKYLALLKKDQVNMDYDGNERLDSREYTEKLYDAILSSKSTYENRIASVRFVPGDILNFRVLFGGIFRQQLTEFYRL